MARDCERHMNGTAPHVASLALGLPHALLALVAGALLITWPWISGRYTIPWDSKAHFLPQLQFLAASLAKGESPFWTPYVFSGHPQIADAQSLIFSPPMFLLAWLDPAPTPWAIDTATFAFVTVSAAALLLWLTDRGVTPAAGAIAGLSFAFGAAMAWRIQHVGQVLSLSYVPFLLLFLDRALTRASLPFAAFAGAAAAALVLGRDQVALLAVYVLAGYVVWHWYDGDGRAERFRRSLAPLLTAGIVGLSLVALPLLMTLELAAMSNRPAIGLEAAGHGSLHPALFLTTLAPDVFGSSGVIGEYWGPPSGLWPGTGLYIAQNMGQFYFGAVPALALVVAAASGRLFDRRARYFLAALAFAVLYGLGWYTPAFRLLHAYLPGVNLYRRPADAVFLIGFLASVVSAFALDDLLRHPQAISRRAAVFTFAAITGLFLVMIGLALQFGKLADAWRYIAIPAALFSIAASLIFALRSSDARTASVLAAALMGFTAIDLAVSNGPGNATAAPPQAFDVLEPATSNETIALIKSRIVANDTRRDRVELVGLGFHWPNASLTHALEHTLGYNPVRLSHYDRAVGAGDHVGVPEQKGFSPLFPSYRSRLADLLGLRFIASSAPLEKIDPAWKDTDLALVAKTADAFVYENTRALPRVLFARAAKAADFEQLLQTGAWPDFDPAETVLLESAPAGDAERGPGSARILAYRHSEILIEADSPSGGYVVLNDTWHPWWFATIDGAPAEIVKANVVFRAVRVPAGKHTLRMTFEPVRGALKQIGLGGN